MRDADLSRLLGDAIIRAQETIPQIPRMRRNFRMWGSPSLSSGLDGGGRSVGTHSDMTGALASKLADSGYDPMREHDQIQRDVLMLSQAAERLHRVMLLATTIVRAEPPDDECMNCSAAGVDPAPFAFERSKASRLCRFCYDFRRDFAVLPAPALCRGSAAGRRIDTGDIREAHPDLVFEPDPNSKGRWRLAIVPTS